MYHELTYKEISRRRRSRIIVAIVCVALFAVLVLGFAASADISRRQAVTTMREAVITAAQQCAAIEGSYPSSLAHLETHYGLIIHHEDYLVKYEWLADNIPPSVTVVAL